MRKIIKVLLALLVLVAGLIWSLQGAGYLLGSFMSGQSQWLYIGLATALVGLVGTVWAARS